MSDRRETSELEQRIIKLEYITLGHGEELTELKDTSEDLKNSLICIQHTLAQIKWIAVGAGAVYFSEALGISNTIKLLTL